MSNPQEEARELFDKIYLIEGGGGNHIIDKKAAKQCALIAVNEKEKTLLSVIGNGKHMWTEYEKSLFDGLQKMKQEIGKL